jgi:hypothetical protein
VILQLLKARERTDLFGGGSKSCAVQYTWLCIGFAMLISKGTNRKQFWWKLKIELY